MLANTDVAVPVIDAGSTMAPRAEPSVKAAEGVATTESPRREATAFPASTPAPVSDAVDETLQRELEELQTLEPTKVYELLRQRFARDVHGADRLCEFAVAEATRSVLIFESFLAAVFAAWLDASSDPHRVVAAALAAVPPDELEVALYGPLTQCALALTRRPEQLPAQPEGQQRALVEALVAAIAQHRDRSGPGIVVAIALGCVTDQAPLVQAALLRLSRSTDPWVRERTWGALSERLPPSALLAVIDEPLPPTPGEHDAKRVLAALRSIRNAPEQADAVRRWLGVRLVDLARRSRYANDPKQDAARVRWLRSIGDALTADDRKALQAELQALADGQGELAERARRLLPH